MASVWGYEGSRVVVSGGGGAGMGAAAVRHLTEIGAEGDVPRSPNSIIEEHHYAEPNSVCNRHRVVAGRRIYFT